MFGNHWSNSSFWISFFRVVVLCWIWTNSMNLRYSNLQPLSWENNHQSSPRFSVWDCLGPQDLDPYLDDLIGAWDAQRHGCCLEDWPWLGYLGFDGNQKSSSLNVIRFMWKVKRPCLIQGNDGPGSHPQSGAELKDSLLHISFPNKVWRWPKHPWNELLKVNQLSEIVFVQSALSWAWLYWLVLVVSFSCDSSSTEVETPALAVVMPLILRGLKDRDERSAFGSCKISSTKDYLQEIVFETRHCGMIVGRCWATSLTCRATQASPCHVKCLFAYLDYISVFSTITLERLLQYGSPSQDDRTKRRALVIADNMCKLVPDVTEIQPFLPTQGDPRVENEGRKSQVLL